MQKLIAFGEQIEGFDIRVLNERAVRAGAGLLFFLAVIAFMNAWLMGNFRPTQVFVVAFLIDFTIRVFITPRYAPSLIVGQWIVRRQAPEWAGAPQKRFAWAIGFVLAVAMLYLVVLNNMIGPLNLIICATCLTFLFFETAFGICIGCKLFNLFNKEVARLCPGGACEAVPTKSSGVTPAQLAVVLLFAVAVIAIAQRIYSTDPRNAPLNQQSGAATHAVPADPAEAERCRVPDFAKALGHEEKWKLHNNCM
jgi:hypothetical protein